jgi:hypothetical protein
VLKCPDEDACPPYQVGGPAGRGAPLVGVRAKLNTKQQSRAVPRGAARLLGACMDPTPGRLDQRLAITALSLSRA